VPFAGCKPAMLGCASSQRRRPAQLDGTHHPPLDAAEMTIMGAPIGVAVAAEDVRHFQAGKVQPVQAGGTTSSVSRSSGLSVRRINPFETRV
jgi:hypothetical protein